MGDWGFWSPRKGRFWEFFSPVGLNGIFEVMSQCSWLNVPHTCNRVNVPKPHTPVQPAKPFTSCVKSTLLIVFKLVLQIASLWIIELKGASWVLRVSGLG